MPSWKTINVCDSLWADLGGGACPPPVVRELVMDIQWNQLVLSLNLKHVFCVEIAEVEARHYRHVITDSADQILTQGA